MSPAVGVVAQGLYRLVGDDVIAIGENCRLQIQLSERSLHPAHLRARLVLGKGWEG